MLTVFSSPSCGWCSKLKEYLRQNDIPFDEVDVSASRENYTRLVIASHQSSVPVTVSDSGEVIIGFDKEKIDRLIAKR